MKNVLIIEASPRDGYSTKTASQVIGMLENKVNIESIALRDLNILPCKGCCACLFSGSEYCPQKKDDVKQILRKMEWADGVIIMCQTTPCTSQHYLNSFLTDLPSCFTDHVCLGKQSSLLLFRVYMEEVRLANI